MKKAIRLLTLVLAVIMVLSFVSCANNNDPAETKEPEKTQAPNNDNTKAPESSEDPTDSDKTTEESKGNDTVTEAPTESESDTKPEGPKPQELADGTMIYYEDFNAFANSNDSDAVIAALQAANNGLWKFDSIDNPLFGDGQKAYKNPTSKYGIENGRLMVYGYTDYTGTAIEGASDTYLVILDGDYMWEVAQKDYTIQYDLCYNESSKADRYIAIVWNYLGSSYDSFHFRVRGTANLQMHFIDTKWYTYDLSAKDGGHKDYYAAGNDKDEADASKFTGTSIAKKLLGLTEDDTVAAFKDIEVTIRIKNRYDDGPEVWMRANGGKGITNDFVKVSEANEGAAGMIGAYWRMMADPDLEQVGAPGGVCLKTGGKMNGYVDNIMIWVGLGDEPADKTVTFKPTPRNAE